MNNCVRMWDSRVSCIIALAVIAYVIYLYLTGVPLPAFMYTLCVNLLAMVIVVAFMVNAIINGDILSAVLMFVAYYGLCYLAGRYPWEFLDNKTSDADEEVKAQ